MIVNGYIEEVRDLMAGGAYSIDDIQRQVLGKGTTPIQPTDTSLETEVNGAATEAGTKDNDIITYESNFATNELNHDIMTECGLLTILPTVTFWESYSTIVSGLPYMDYLNHSTVFQTDDTWYLIAGEYHGDFYGFKWTGTTWVTDTGIINGLPTGGNSTSQCASIWIDDVLYIMVDSYNLTSTQFYSWDGTIWNREPDYENGLPDTTNQHDNIGTIFQMGDTLYLIRYYDSDKYVYLGFKFTEGGWISWSKIVAGLPASMTPRTPRVVQIYGVWYLIGGTEYVMTGYKFVDEEWIVDTEIVSGLHAAAPVCIFFTDNYWYLIGCDQHFSDGRFYGHRKVYDVGTLVNRSVFIGFEKTSQFKLKVSTYMKIENE